MSKINQNFEKKTDIIEPISSESESGLDVNLIISSFQEKLSQLMTELVVKEATIKQLSNIIEKMKGH